MPFGKYKDFQDCVNDQIDQDNSEMAAKKICGTLQKKLGGSYDKNLTQTQILQIVQDDIPPDVLLSQINRENMIKIATDYGLSRTAAQKVLKNISDKGYVEPPTNIDKSFDPNYNVLPQVGAEPEPDEGTAKEEAADMQEMMGPTFDNLGADQANNQDEPANYDINSPTLDDNVHAQKHLQAALEADKTPDQLFIIDAESLKSAAKCTEGKYKGEICMAPPDGFPVTDGGKVSAKRVRAAITYGVQYGKIATLKKNGLCRYAKQVGVDTKFCQGGTQEAAINETDYQIKPFEQNNKLFIKAFLLDTSMNLNQWGVSPTTLDANINSYIGKPICLQQDFGHPNSGDDNLEHQLVYQDSFRIGTIVDISKHGTRYDAIAEITDENSKSAFRSGSLPLYVSPQLYHLGAAREGQENMTEWIGTHLAIVDKPAYGVKKANVGSQCNGDSITCLAQLKKASLNKMHGYGNCGFCNYKLLMSKAV
jgi:hypothetical protein